MMLGSSFSTQFHLMSAFGHGAQVRSPLARLSCATWILPDVHHRLLGGGWGHGRLLFGYDRFGNVCGKKNYPVERALLSVQDMTLKK